MNRFYDYLKSLASLKLSVVLFALSMFLILAGTLAQTNEGVWTVVDSYFRSLFVLIPLQIFVPLKVARIPGVLPFPVGMTLGILLFINLLAAHAVRFSLSWKRSGIILAHAGVLLLLVGEFVTGAFAKEGNMSIEEGGSANFVEDSRSSELAVVDPSDPNNDFVVVVPQRMLARDQSGAIAHGLLPFEIRVDEWMSNSHILGPMQASKAQLARATVGTGKQIAAVPAAPANGVDGAMIDIPAAYITLFSSGKELGTYMVSPQLNGPQQVDVGGKPYLIQLRFKREYRPYTVTLIDFKHDKFTGTEMARNFSSQVRLTDPENHVDREVLIYMNHPLRHAGETFYQSAFMQDDRGTILQVVKNPGWLLPYISCGMVTLGLLMHFGVRLATSVRRKAA